MIRVYIAGGAGATRLANGITHRDISLTLGIMPESWQVRAEMEWPDAHTVVPPPGWKWSATCFSIVNSDGLANDPQRRLVRYGGQLHTPAAPDPDQLAALTAPMFTRLRPIPNYRAAMRVAVKIPQLRQDLPLLKTVADFTQRHLPRLWSQIDPLDPLLDLGGVASPIEQRAAAARLTATIRSRHYLMPMRAHAQRMNATTLAAFAAQATTLTPDGRVLPVPLREAVDVRHTPRSGWVVLRCFACPADAEQLRAAAGFAVGWLRHAIDGADPAAVATLVARWSPGLPRQLPYHHGLEMGWRQTNFLHNSRQVVAARLAQLPRRAHR